MTETKLKFLGYVKASVENKEDLDYKLIAEELDVSESTLKKWSKQLKEQEDVTNILDIDQIILDRVTKELETELAGIPQTRVNPVTGEIELIKPEDQTVAKRSAKVESFKKGVEGLQLLSEETQGVAAELLDKISDQLVREELNSRDLSNLTNAVTSIQNAFFNKPTTNVQVNNIQAGEDNPLLAAFRERMKN